MKFDDENKTVKLLMKSKILLEELKQREKDKTKVTSWELEYGAFMIEGTPRMPYKNSLEQMVYIETNMKIRRDEIQQMLESDEKILTLTAFPRTGCPNFTFPETFITPDKGYARSIFFPDEAIFGHPKMRTFTRNVRERRGCKPVINVPIYKDLNTPVPFKEDFKVFGDNGECQNAALVDNIYMDSLSFGPSCCCIQVTMQAHDLQEAKYLYDQLANICPIMLAVSAASPIYRGYLSDIDNRWEVLTQAVDDRTPAELHSQETIHKTFRPRWDSVDCYLSESNTDYNLRDVIFDPRVYQTFIDNGVEEPLARHFAYIFLRDPMFLYEELLEQNHEEETDHFDNFNTANYQTLRLKIPPCNTDDIGWRVEFRPMDLQLTDKENAAYAVFVILLSRVIITYKLDLVIPLSKVDENMTNSYDRDAVRNQTFYFRQHIMKDCLTKNCSRCVQNPGKSCIPASRDYRRMTIDEIINGTEDFVGLIPLINKYLDGITTDTNTKQTIEGYLKIISYRASGKMKTTAKWIREFVRKHPEYKHDSVVTEKITYDLLKKISDTDTDIYLEFEDNS